MKLSKKKTAIIISAVAATAVAAVLVFTLVCFHTWREATCVLPMTCEKCGKTKGSPLGHEWIEATCKEPRHCVKCGLEQGVVLEHNWIEATCTEPKTCKDCMAAEGEPLGHSVRQWKITKKATCTNKGERTGFCDRCNKNCVETIKTLSHTKSDWIIKKDYVFNPDGSVEAGTQAVVCTVCNKEIDTREYTVKLTMSQKNAVICAYNEISFWHCGPDFLINHILVENNDFSVADSKLAVSHIAIDWQEQAILHAKENCSGSSRVGLADRMSYYGFNSTQINTALKEVGY